MNKSRQQSDPFTRGLSDRHIQLIAIGGAIGVGLFLGSAKAIQTAGPALMLSYALGGLVIFFIMRALGELAIYRPISGSFSTYAAEFIGPWAGFATGWTYWFMWVVTGMAEITAVGMYAKFWFPQLPQWIPALIALFFVYLINLIAVKLFGEVEFWFALIKVVTIIALIVIGLVMITTGWGNHGEPIGFSNLWSHQGFFPFGLTGVLFALQMVMFAFLGVELVGVTAGEAENPEKTLPSAINKILWRILIFYIGALAIIMALYPWTDLDGKTSPFVLTFERIGIPAAAGIINFVVLTAALSSCNSGIFSTGRMLFTLASAKQAPQALARVSKRKVPATGITVSSIALLIGVVLNYVIPEKAFTYITSIATTGAIWTWGIIVYAHLKYRKAVKEKGLPESSFKMPGAPWTNWLVLLFLGLVTVLLGLDSETRIALYVAPVWFGILAIGYQVVKARQKNAASDSESDPLAG
ncbi:amino acid permease [Lihuaxuella thermophila]|uniref:Amino acid transporter, AAT family/D-serine/D-alanine/glycine transporter n=1 Tax=Lihuaxuella thermophila TaxID=1173111 RepID=A0A1H8FBQ9_9BACL|nr:amino acid permease [Lihuaxuella thermophila]SEN29253.1 amino acid transporter, AAT family/D-serine/D-alanine/glycine transporter [Lihuaxuella thermophila]